MKAVVLMGIIGAILLAQGHAQAQNQTIVVIPSFQDRFAGPNAQVISVTTTTPTTSSGSGIIPVVAGSAAQGQTRQADSRTSSDASSRNAVQFSAAGQPNINAQAQANSRRITRLDAATMNIPVFPGTAAIQEANPTTTVTVFPNGIGAPGTNFFGQALGFGFATNLAGQFVPTSALPGPATNALPRPAAPGNIGQPSAVNGSVPTIQGFPVGPTPSGTTTIAPAPGTPATAPRVPADAVPSPAAPPRTR